MGTTTIGHADSYRALSVVSPSPEFGGRGGCIALLKRSLSSGVRSLHPRAARVLLIHSPPASLPNRTRISKNNPSPCQKLMEGSRKIAGINRFHKMNVIRPIAPSHAIPNRMTGNPTTLRLLIGSPFISRFLVETLKPISQTFNGVVFFARAASECSLRFPWRSRQNCGHLSHERERLRAGSAAIHPRRVRSPKR